MKKKNLLYVLAGLFMVISCQTDYDVPPVNDNAIPEARRLLNYVYSIKGEKIMSGQHNYSHELERSSDSVLSFTGKYPAVWGSDFIGKRHRQDMIEEVIRQHKSGSIITLMYHQGRPYEDSIGHFRDTISDAEWIKLVTPGTAIHQTWLDDIDSVAFWLKKLQDENIPVLWRPYHEMNGTWFWWCDKKGENGIQALWKLMFDRFVNHHQLNNIIWVWNANGPRDWEDDEAYAYRLYFPGLEYVDILATDIYKADYKQSHHDDLLDLAEGKPIALGEVGQLPTPEILEQQPQWTWFMVWARFIWRANEPGAVRDIYNLQKTLTKDEVNISQKE
jgi:mannan endo-1,4-beta-mannosidase